MSELDPALPQMAAHRGIALITGGCGGLGLAFANNWLLSGGRFVKLVDLAPRAAADAAIRQLEAAHAAAGRIEYVEADVTRGDELAAAFGACDGRELGLVVNNAGVGELGFAKWRQQLDVNLVAVVDGTRLALDAFGADPAARAGDGDRVVVNVASMAGLVPLSPSPVYTASKFGVVGFSRAMHAEARRAHRGVRVHALCPSFARTGMMNEGWIDRDRATARVVEAFGGMMTPETVADAMFEKLVDAPSAPACLNVTPLRGAEYDAPTTHPVETAIKMAHLRRVGPIEAARQMLWPKKKKHKRDRES